MAADDHHGFGRSGQRRGNVLEKAPRCVPCVGRAPCPIHEKAGAAPVRKKNRRLALGVVGHYFSSALLGVARLKNLFKQLYLGCWERGEDSDRKSTRLN